jgi:uncharacterized protein with PhoU and TrkA domain
MNEPTIEKKVREIKDTSELMIDLAYSSLLYDNKIIADEVYDLENIIDEKYDQLQREILSEVQKGNLTVDAAIVLMNLSRAGEEIADAAREIADVELRDVELHPIIKLSIRESDEVITKVQVLEQSILCGKNLGDLKLGTDTGMTVIAMRHGNNWLYGPNKKTKIDPNDILFAKGPEDGEKHLIELAKGETNEI